jgi:uncharacterized membrane protein
MSRHPCMTRFTGGGMLLLLLLSAGCADDPVTPSQNVQFSTGGDATSFDVIELGTLTSGNQAFASATAIRTSGGGALVVGYSHFQGDLKAVTWSVTEDGSVTGPTRLGEVLSPLGEDNYPYQTGRDINTAGVAVGGVYRREGPYLYSQTLGYVFDGTMRLLPWLLGRTNAWYAWAINEPGMVVGWLRYSERDEDGTLIAYHTRGALWLPPYEDAPVLLDPLPGHGSAQARTVNDDGFIAGWSFTGADTTGVYWTADAAGQITGPWPIAAGFRSTAANATRHVAGHAFGQAAHWDPASNTLTRLGLLKKDSYSQAYGINDVGPGSFSMVGWSGRSLDQGDRVPVLWNSANGSTGPAIALPMPSGYSSGFASDADNRTWIVGRGDRQHRSQTTSDALLWRPRPAGGDEGEVPCNPHPRTGACR